MCKKKILGMMGIAAFLMMTALNIRLSSDNNSALSDLVVLANIEILAQTDEIGRVICNVIGYTDAWKDGCLYYCAQCAESYYVAINLIHCSAR
jgi:hypothetical protein